jgi:hypothetical protein
MTAENYLFEYMGAPLRITIDLDAGALTTTAAPNMRVVEGTWRTWRLEVDRDVPGPDGIRLYQCTDGATGEHPLGNLTASESSSPGEILLLAPSGALQRMAAGWVAAHRLMTGT